MMVDCSQANSGKVSRGRRTTRLPSAPRRCLSQLEVDRDGHDDRHGRWFRSVGVNSHCRTGIEGRLIEQRDLLNGRTFASMTFPSAPIVASTMTTPAMRAVLAADGTRSNM